jgi:hypothetical protein
MFHQNFLFMKTKSFTLTGHQWLLPLLLAIFLGWSHIASAQTSCTSYSLEFTNNQYGPAGLIFCGNSVSGQVVVVNTGQVDNKGNFVPTTGATIAYYYTYDNPNLNPNPTWISPGGGGTTGVNLNNTYFKNSEVVWWKAEVTTGSNTCTTSIIAVYKTSVPGITGPDPVTQPNPLNITGPCDACIPFGHGENLTIATPIDHEVNYYLNGSTIPFATKPYGGIQSPLCYTFGYGTFTVTVVATNYCGTTTKSFTVTTYDNTPPQLTGTLPTGQTGMNLCYANLPGGPEAAAIALLYDDNCTDVYVDKTAYITGDDCGWSATYTYDVYDGAGNHVTPSPTVVYTGSDQTAPTVAKGTISSCYPTVAAAEAAAIAATTYSDNCAVNAYLTVSALTSGTCTATVTVSVKDPCNNSASVSYSTRIDNTPPVLSATPANVTVNCQSVPSVPTITATDNCDGNVSVYTDFSDTKGTNPAQCSYYTYTITRKWSAQDLCGNTVSHTQVITVQDITPPIVTKGTIGSCYPTVAAAEAAAIAATTYSDNCAANAYLTVSALTSGTCTATVTVSVKDPCNNSASVSYSTRIDNTPPVLSATPANVTVNCQSVPSVPTITATDNCDGNVTVYTDFSDTKGTNPAQCSYYTYTITRKWSAQDLCGNTVNHTQVITVQDITPPIVTKGTIGSCYPNVAAAETAAIAATTYSDNCAANAYLTVSALTSGTCTATVTVSVKDPCNNSASVSYSTRIDNTPPVPPTIANITGLACKSQVPAPGDVYASDVCSGQVLGILNEQTNNGTGCYGSPYVVTRLWTFTDDCGNASSTDQTITVEADELTVDIDPVADPDRPFCNTTGNLLSANDPEGGCEPYTYYWSLSPANEGWVITDGAGDELATPPVAGSQTITYNTGNVGVDITFYVKVVDGNGCIATYDVTFDCQGGAYCTYTQGFYGGLGGVDCENNTTVETIEKAFEGYLPATSVQIGSSVTDNLILNDVDANCIIGRLPGGGSEAAITGLNTCANMPGIMLQSNSTKIANTLVAQAITLTLNIGLNPELPNLVLPANKAYMITIEALDCYNFQSLPDPNGMEVNYPIPVNVTAYLNGNNGYAPNVQGLLDLANDAISGVILPGTPPTLSEITNAMGTINNGFDDCRVIVGWGVNETPPAKLTQVASTSGNLTMFPNPTSGNVSILIPEEGFTHLRVVSFDGKTVKEISQQDLEGQLRITIDMQNVAHGIYYVFAYHNNTLVQKGKLVIVR